MTIESYFGNKLEDEKLLLDENIVIRCNELDINQQSKGTIIGTNYRLRLQSRENEGWFITFSLNAIVNLTFANQVFTLKVSLYDKERDRYEIYWVEVTQFSSHVQTFFSDMIENRLQYPSYRVDDYYELAMTHLRAGKSDVAKKAILDAKVVDEITLTTDLLYMNLLFTFGEDKNATLYLIDKWDEIIRFKSVYLLWTLMATTWSEQAYNWFVNKSNLREKELAGYFSQVIRHRLDGNSRDALMAYYKFAYNYGHSPHSGVFLVGFMSFFEEQLFDIHKALLQGYIKASLKDKTIDEAEAKALSDEFLSLDFDEAIALFIDEEPEEALGTACNSFLKHDFSACLEYANKGIAESDAPVECWSATDVYLHPSFSLADLQVLSLFSKLRLGTESDEKLFQQLKAHEEVYARRWEARPMLIEVQTMVSYCAYYFSAIELNLRMQKSEEAYGLISNFRMILDELPQVKVVPIYYCAKEILDFYEGWLLKSFTILEKAVKKLDGIEGLGWIDSLYDHVIATAFKDLSILKDHNGVKQAIQTLLTALNHLNDLASVPAEMRLRIQEQSQQIKAQLEQKELSIAIIGETSSGKTTFLNRLFDTELFYVTQEEATGVPTEVRYRKNISVEVLNKNGEIFAKLDKNRVVDLSKENGLDKLFSNLKNVFVKGPEVNPAEFIETFTKVAVTGESEVERVKVCLPIENLPRNIAIIDTPGFNANHHRTEIAREVIRSSHAGLFVIDARQPLKRKELEAMQFARNEVGKLVFVLNKMDLALKMDEEEVDELLEYVESQLKESFKLDKLDLYPVISVKGTTTHPRAVQYDQNIATVKALIEQLAFNESLNLLMEHNVKIVNQLSDELLRQLEDLVSSSHHRERELKNAIPEDTALFIDSIYKEILHDYRANRQIYIELMENEIESELMKAVDHFSAWLNGLYNIDQMSKEANGKAELYLNEAISTIEQSRKDGTKDIHNKTLRCIDMTFDRLYSGLNIKSPELPKSLNNYLATLDASSTKIFGEIETTHYNDGAATAGGIGGAVVGGLLLGPVGFVIGGVLGSLFGTSSRAPESVRKELIESFQTRVSDIYDHMIKAYNEDLDHDKQNGFVAALYENIDERVSLLFNEVKNESTLLEKEFAQLQADLYKQKRYVSQIADQVSLLNEWRNRVRKH